MEIDTNRRRWLSGTGLTLAAAALARAPLRAMLPLGEGAACDGARRGPIRLGANENPHGPSESARKAIVEALSASNRYPEGVDELKALIAAREGLTPEHVVLAPGSHAVLCIAGLVYGLPDGEIVSDDPTYPGLATYAAGIGARVTRVPLTADFAHDLDAMEARVGARTRLVYVCNPNNPTGTVVSAVRLRAFCDAVAPRAAVLVDEAYGDYAGGPGSGFASMVELVRKGANVLVVKTFSKLHGLAGLRIGYALARPDIADRLRTFRMGPDSTSVGVLSVAAARASYQDLAFQETSKRKNAEARAYTLGVLDELRLPHAASHTNFVYFRVPGDVEDFGRAMEREEIRLVARPSIGGCRVTIGTLDEMHAFAGALGRVVRPAPALNG